nr:hypothetical protein [Chitinophagaceae bacterium]
MQPAPSSRLRKLAVTFIAAFAILNLLFLFTEALPQAWLEKLGDNAFSILLAAQLGLTLLIAAVYAFRWHRREQADPSVSGPRYAWLHAIIRYWLAFEIATYGWAKILRTQFQGNYMTEDMTLANSSGFSLTWYYFGYSYILACIIGAVQITGSAMLLFRRTTLLGTILLLPVMLNIVLINLFYDIAAGAFLNSVAFTTGLCYLLSLHWTELRKTILGWKDQLPAVGKAWMRWLL